ncbi:FadR/GntR family transcriptional regulator [Kitasatospora cheerisanensis]|uniref:FadR/GntR family transcriptional regulator n=1 Tax=Kitasatospora cheerisanensis TaxID=81942 RepID=UPI00068E6999|nr:GntR family transcriptional regulator [Kitasatospora cheerisanensis]
MNLRPVGAMPLSGQIHRQLMDAILDGTLTGALPSERELAETFGANRHAVREAIKRLQQARLVEVQQGGATRVLNIPDHAGLDLLPELVAGPGRLNHEATTGVLELRACIGADAARLCAERSPGVGAALLDLLPDAAMPDAELAAGSAAYWTALVAGTDSLPYRLALNTLLAGLDAIGDSPAAKDFMTALREESRRADELEQIAHAIRRGDAPAAGETARRLLNSSIPPR